MKNFAHLLLISLLLLGPSPIKALTYGSTTPKTILTVTEATMNNYLGYSMKSAGDVDGDGYDDVIIGAYGKSQIYVVYGGPTSALATSIPVADLDPATTGFTITGNTGEQFGYSVSSAGDFNNDGYDDILIGAPFKNSKRGIVYVVYGAPRSSMADVDLTTSILDPLATGFTISGNTLNDNFGCSVSSAGDLNKDGYDDIIIGAFGKSTYKGAAYVIYGRGKLTTQNIELNFETLNPLTTGFMITGTANSWFGYSVTGGGDINKDGYDDIVIGSHYKNSVQGAVYVVYGGEKSTMSTLDIAVNPLNPTTTGFTMTGEASNNAFGRSVSNAGDINNDGYADIVIGASSKNKVYVVYGGEKSSLSNIDFASQTLNPSTTGFTITGNTNEEFGTSVSSAGDINKDGYADIVIGAYAKDTSKGAAFVVFGGKESSRINIDLSSTTNVYSETIIFSILGDTSSSSKLGNSVDFSDVNSDGYSEILIGAPTENNKKGSTYILIFQQCPNNCQICGFPSACTLCSQGYGLQGSQCALCPLNCQSCLQASTCQTCSSSDFLFQGSCVPSCPSPTIPQGQTCILCSDAMDGCEMCTSESICIYCNAGRMKYRNNQCVAICPSATFTIAGECIDCPFGCSGCESSTTCTACINGYTLKETQGTKLCVLKQRQPPQVETTTEIEEKDGEKAAAGAFEGVSIVGAALGSGSSLPLNFGLVAKILRNIKYMKLPVSRELYETFYSWKVASGFMSAPGSWSEKYSSKTIPVMFSRYKLQSAFLINFWKPLVMTLIGIAVFGIFKLIEANMGNNKKSTVYSISKQVNVAASNFALTQFYSNLDDVLFYFILEMRSTKFETGFRVCSSLLAIVLFLVGAIFMIMHSQILGRYQKLKEASSTPQLEDFVSRFANVNLIFKDFKDTNSLTQSFLMINVGRSVLSSLIFATLFEYPMIQISFLIVLNTLMIVYLWNLKSFQEFTNTCSQMFCEVILFIANICVFLLALFDHADSYPVPSIERLGKCIIVVNLILLVGCALLMLVNVGKMLYKIYQNKKKPLQQGLQPPFQVKKLVSTRPTDLTQAHQNFSTKTAFESEKSQQNFEMNQYQNPGESYGNLDKDPNVRYQQEISNNYSIHHPSRNQNPANFDAQIDSFEMPNSNTVHFISLRFIELSN